MGFLRRKSTPPPPPPAPPAPAVQPPKVTTTVAKKKASPETDASVAASGGVKTAPTIQTTARGITEDAPLLYASLLGQVRKNNGMLQ